MEVALNLIGIAVAVNWGINAVAGALAVVALVMLPVWKLVVGKYSPVAPTLTNAQYLSIAAALSAMAGSVLILERFTSGLSPLSQIACQWLAGFFVYGIIVCALDRSLRAAVQDLLTLGIGRR